MKIAIISKLWENTEPESTGGTGAALGYLVNALAKRGHEITLFATGASKAKAQKLIAVRKNPFKDDYSEIEEIENIANAFRRDKNFDIIHAAVEHKSLFFAKVASVPVLHSIRYGEFFQQELDLLKKHSQENFVGISKAVCNKFNFLNFQGMVYNGLDLSFFPFINKPGNYLVFLARISPSKGVHTAIEVAKKLNQKLIIAGKVSAVDKDYLDKYFWPQIDGKQIVYKGELAFKDKVDLLKNAYCLLHPIENIFEAFGMSLIEAQACGTPVVSYDSGSPKEVISPGKTGFVVSSFKEMLKAVKELKNVSRQDSRDWVEKNFNSDLMALNYEKLYNKIINK
ncbi:MAG: glycosyltransferase family 4 protein [Candidatus Pacebacteria bacterium]|nr:glycosyltransferase family 4 protein [Candidatus Paceibacterota bacterium]